jgi:hypothetical protein
MGTSAEILEEVFKAIQELLEEDEQILLTSKTAQLLKRDRLTWRRLTWRQDELIAIGTQPIAAMLGGRDAEKDEP